MKQKLETKLSKMWTAVFPLKWEIWEKCEVFGQILLILNQKLILENAKLKNFNKKLEYFNARLWLLYLGKANSMQKFCKRGPQSSETFGQKFEWIYYLGKFALVKILEGTLVDRVIVNCDWWVNGSSELDPRL